MFACLQLKLEGVSIEEGEVARNPEFLMEILELNEELDEATTADKISKIEEKNKGNKKIDLSVFLGKDGSN